MLSRLKKIKKDSITQNLSIFCNMKQIQINKENKLTLKSMIQGSELARFQWHLYKKFPKMPTNNILKI